MGILPEKPAFPAVVDCPSCSQPHLYLFDDVVCDGVWSHCENCGAHGDIILFGSQIWNTTIADAMTRFVDMGAASRGEVDRLAGEYLRAITRLKAAEAFWETARGQLWNHHDDVIACRQRELGLDSSVAACDGLIGVAHPDQIAEFCHAAGRAVPRRVREHGPSLVLPHYDLPGRLSGMLLVQYSDEFASKRTFIPLGWHVKRRPEAGYFMLHTVMQPAPAALRNLYFVTDDPFWALQAQCAQLKCGLNMLPLAASFTGPEAVSSGLNWQSFARVPRLFHASTYTAEAIAQACNAKGYVCVLPPEALAKPMNPARVMVRLGAIRHRAQTWQQTLETVLTDTNETAAQAFVTKLHIELDRLQHFFKTRKHSLSPDFCARVLSQVELGPGVGVKIQRRALVIERDGGWFTHTNNQICNAQVRIDKVVHAETGARLYAGRVLVNKKELEFVDAADRIERIGLLAYAAQHAAAQGIFISFDRHWNARSHLAAMQLHEPEILHVSGQGGWNEKTNQFCFKSYAMDNEGGLLPFNYPQINLDVPDFPEPGQLAPVTIHSLLTPSHENALIWSAFAVIAANLLAPVVGRAPIMTGVVGTAYGAAQPLGAALSCAELRSSGVNKHNVATAVLQSAQAARWPLFAAHAFNDVNMCRAVLRIPAGATLVRLHEVTAAVAASYGWQTIRGPASSPPPDFSALRYVLPSYIQHALAGRMALVTRNSHLPRAVLADLAEYLKDIYGATFNLACAANRLTGPGQAHEALMRAVNLGITSGKLDILPRPRRRDQAGNYVLRQKTHWWLNQRAIERYCVAVGGIGPNWAAVTELLQREGLLQGEQLTHDMPGLLVNKDWCDRFWSDYTTDAREFG
jgi:hypothetical protein